MKLVAVRVKGFRSLFDAQIDGLSDINCLVGRNNTGKTALLESLLLLGTTPLTHLGQNPVEACYPWHRPVEDVIADSRANLRSDSPIGLTLEFLPSDADAVTLGGMYPPVEYEISQHVAAARVVFRLEMRLPAGWENASFIPTAVSLDTGEKEYPLIFRQAESIPDDNAETIPDNAVYLAPVGPDLLQMLNVGKEISMYSDHGGSYASLFAQALEGEGPQPFKLILNWIPGIRFVSCTRQVEHAVALSTTQLLRSDGSNLARYFQHLYNNQPLQWQELKQILSTLVPWLRDIYAPISADFTSARVAVRNDQDVGQAFALTHMGSGTVHLMTIVAMVWSTPNGGLCLIEEPEEGLHGSAQRDLLLWLDLHAKQRDKQLILTTHSTLFAQPKLGISVFLATYDPATGTEFRSVTTGTVPEVAAELGTRLGDLYAYDCVLFLEGETEAEALPSVVSALNMDLEVLGVRPVPLKGDVATRLQRLREYLEYMRDSQVIPFLLADDTPDVRNAVAELTTEGLLAEDDVRIWTRNGKAGEFEDNFSDEQLVAAMNQLAKEEEASGEIGISELHDLRTKKPNATTSRLLKELYHGHFAYGLPKPRLGRILGELAAQDIVSGNKSYPFVQALERLQTAVLAKSETR